MLVTILCLVGVIVILFSYYYVRSLKQTEVLVFDKGSLFSQSSRFLVCPKCGRAQARNGGYQECCRTRL